MNNIKRLKKYFIDLWYAIRMDWVVTLLKLSVKLAPNNNEGKRILKMLLIWSTKEIKIMKGVNNVKTN